MPKKWMIFAETVAAKAETVTGAGDAILLEPWIPETPYLEALAETLWTAVDAAITAPA